MTGPGWGSGPWSPPWAGPPTGSYAPPPGAPPHDQPQPHALLMRTRDWAWWRPLLGLLLFVVLYAVAAVVVVVVALVTAAAPDLALTDLIDPAVLLITNASLIVAIPIVWLCWAVPHGVRIGWSSSVLGRLRWRLFAPFTWRALATLGVVIGLSVLVALLGGEQATGPVGGIGWLLVVVLLTTPLQSAAEEYVFRGYLSQTIAGWIGRPRPGAVVAGLITAALFSAAHAPPDFLTFADRFVFGLAASAVVALTGGLEAAIVLHAVNNVLVFSLAGLLGAGVETDSSAGGAAVLDVLLTVIGMSAYVGLVALSRRRLHPEVVSPALDLRGRSSERTPFPPGQAGYRPPAGIR